MSEAKGYDWFRFFVRKNYPLPIKVSNNDLDELGAMFRSYIENKLPVEIQVKIIPATAMDVVFNMDKPFHMNGFHVALAAHFHDFIKEKFNQNK